MEESKTQFPGGIRTLAGKELGDNEILNPFYDGDDAFDLVDPIYYPAIDTYPEFGIILNVERSMIKGLQLCQKVINISSLIPLPARIFHRMSTQKLLRSEYRCRKLWHLAAKLFIPGIQELSGYCLFAITFDLTQDEINLMFDTKKSFDYLINSLNKSLVMGLSMHNINGIIKKAMDQITVVDSRYAHETPLMDNYFKHRNLLLYEEMTFVTFNNQGKQVTKLQMTDYFDIVFNQDKIPTAHQRELRYAGTFISPQWIEGLNGILSSFHNGNTQKILARHLAESQDYFPLIFKIGNWEGRTAVSDPFLVNNPSIFSKAWSKMLAKQYQMGTRITENSSIVIHYLVANFYSCDHWHDYGTVLDDRDLNDNSNDSEDNDDLIFNDTAVVVDNTESPLAKPRVFKVGLEHDTSNLTETATLTITNKPYICYPYSAANIQLYVGYVRDKFSRMSVNRWIDLNKRLERFCGFDVICLLRNHHDIALCGSILPACLTNRVKSKEYQHSDIDIMCNARRLDDYYALLTAVAMSVEKICSDTMAIMVEPIVATKIYITHDTARRLAVAATDAKPVAATDAKPVAATDAGGVNVVAQELYNHYVTAIVQEMKREQSSPLTCVNVVQEKIRQQLLTVQNLEDIKIFKIDADYGHEPDDPYCNNEIKIVVDDQHICTIVREVKLKIHMQQRDTPMRTIELFRAKQGFAAMVAKFHFPPVHCYYNHAGLYVLPSALTTYKTGIMMDMYSSSYHRTPELMKKYIDRGFAMVFTKQEIETILSDPLFQDLKVMKFNPALF